MQIRKYLQRLMMGLSPGRSKGSIKEWSVVELKVLMRETELRKIERLPIRLDICDRLEKGLH